MKKIIPVVLLFALITACNNSNKDSVEKADSANDVNTIISSDNSAAFLVRVANSGLAEVQVTSIAQQKAQNQEVKDFAAMLYHDHSALNDVVKGLASQKSITLPDSITADKKEMISNLEQKSGKEFDKEFISAMISAHVTSIESFEKVAKDESDAEVKNFAEQTLPKLREHHDKAVALQKKYFTE
jgi:putative membrane protein